MRLDLRIRGGGVFPHADAAEVLWAGVAGAGEELTALARGARTALGVAGVRVDGQRFHPHVTVARSGRPVRLGDWVRLLDVYDGPAWRAEEVAVVASHLGEGADGRPRHEVLAVVPLGGEGAADH